MSNLDFATFEEDFFGSDVLSATQADNSRFRLFDTSAAGQPTYVYVNGSPTGEVAVDMEATSEVQNVGMYQSDILQFSIDKLMSYDCRLKMNQAAVNAATTFAFGLVGTRNAAIASMTERILFRILGSGSTTNVLLDAADGTNSVISKSSGTTLINAYKWFKIDFSRGKGDIRFFIDGQPVGTANTFSMSAITSSLQLLWQIQKTAATPVDGFTVDYVRVVCRR